MKKRYIPISIACLLSHTLVKGQEPGTVQENKVDSVQQKKR
jgi:hypothetical protein